MLIVGSAVSTCPTKPCGATTALYWRTPALLPAVNVTVVTKSKPCSTEVCRASAGMNPHPSRRPSPISLRSLSFSEARACEFIALSAVESRESVYSSRISHDVLHRSAPCCKPTSGATAVRRKNSATLVLGPTRAMTASATLTASSRASTRARSRGTVATSTSGAQNRPVLFLVVEDAARAAHHAGQRIFVHVDGEICFLAQQQVESAYQRAAARHDDAAIDNVARQLRRRNLQR